MNSCVAFVLAALMHHATAKADSTIAALREENAALKQQVMSQGHAIAAFKRLPTYQRHKEAFMRDVSKPQTTNCRAASLRAAGQGICESRETLLQLISDNNGDAAIRSEVHDAQATAQSPQERATLPQIITQIMHNATDGGSQHQVQQVGGQHQVQHVGGQHGGFDDGTTEDASPFIPDLAPANANQCCVCGSPQPANPRLVCGANWRTFGCYHLCPEHSMWNWNCTHAAKVLRCRKMMVGVTSVRYQSREDSNGMPFDSKILEKIRKIRLARAFKDSNGDPAKWTPATKFLNSFASEQLCYNAITCAGLDSLVEGHNPNIDQEPQAAEAKNAANSLGIIDLLLTKTLTPRDCTADEKKKKKGVGKCQAFEVKKKCELNFPDQEKHKIADMFAEGGIKDECSML